MVFNFISTSCLFCIPALLWDFTPAWPVPPRRLGKAHKGCREVCVPAADWRALCIRPGEGIFKKHLLCASYQSRPFP